MPGRDREGEMGTDCEEVRELLPWHVAGTLGPEEERAVAGHLASCPACREELAATERVARIASFHVPTVVLTAYAFGEEDVGLDRGVVERHLVHCPSCREELALAERAAALPPGPTRAPARQGRPLLALAASLLVGLGIGAFWWVPRTGGPWVEGDVALVELVPESLALRGAEAATRLPVGRSATLVLVTDLEVGEGSYRVRLLGPDGGELWAVRDLRPSEGGTFVLHLAAASEVPDGSSLVLESEGPDGWRPLETYPLTTGD